MCQITLETRDLFGLLACFNKPTTKSVLTYQKTLKKTFIFLGFRIKILNYILISFPLVREFRNLMGRPPLPSTCE